MKIWRAAWTAGTILAGAPIVSAQEAVGVPTALVVAIHVTDNANLSPTDLAGAQAFASAAYRAAGLDIVWSSAPWNPEEDQRAGSRAIDVRLVIVPREMAEKKCREEQLGNSVLGTATSGARTAVGRIAYIFYDRIARVAALHQVPIVRGVGHVMAHEIGHLLIGVSSHADEGLMRAGWNPRERRPQTFTRNQMRQIRRRFMATPDTQTPLDLLGRHQTLQLFRPVLHDNVPSVSRQVSIGAILSLGSPVASVLQASSARH